MLSIIGLVLLIVAVVLFFIKRNQSHRAFSLQSARAVTAAELHDTAKEVAAEIGGGSWRDYVKVWGKATTLTPLTSPLKDVPCVYYDSKVMRVYEETVTSTDSEGKTSRRQERRSETVSQNSQSVPFRVVDSSGSVEVNPDGASIEAEQILDEFRPGNAQGGLLSYGNFSFTLNFGSSNSTLGYRYVESIVPVERNVLVVGGVSDATGSPVVGKPPSTEKRKFIISLKSDQMLTESAANMIKWLNISMLGCFGLGLVLLLAGLFV